MKQHIGLLLCFLALSLAAIPVPVCAQSASQERLRLHTVVIDPGHGGKDAGCVSRDKQTYEKTITLDIAKRLSKKISAAYRDVNVKMTRSEDVFVELENRAVIANKANASLFISIHVNAVEKGTTANGYSIHVLGQSQRAGNDLYSKNLDLVKRENAVIMLEDNYQTKYQGFDPNDPQSSIIFSLMQNAHLTASLTFAEDVANAMGKNPVIKHSRGVSQDPFWVLWRTAMPAVLIEVGFMTNPEDLATMRTEKGREGIAENIFQAFKTFKTRYDSSMSVAAETPSAQPEESVKKEEPKKEEPKADLKKEDVKKEEPKKEEPKVESKKEEPKKEVTPKEEPKKAEPVKEPSQPEPATLEKGTVYAIQILASAKPIPLNDPFFAGYKVNELKSGKYYKYVICANASLKKVRSDYTKVQVRFKDSFLVKVVDGTIGPIH